MQTYTPGTTSFLGNNKTGCTSSTCSENTYTMSERTARARLITVSEVWQTGCQMWNARTCPKYMYNYLKTANGYGGTVDGHEVSMAYWIMNARSDLSTGAWIVYCEGDISYNVVGEARHSARAVIEINK